MAHLDRLRAERLMAEAAIDALILLSPESFRYATGAEPGVATMWRRAGAVAVLVPADAATPEMAVASDLFAAGFRASSHIADLRIAPIWVETADLEAAEASDPAEAVASAWKAAGRLPGFSRPATFDPGTCWRHLRDGLAERGLLHGRIGVEMDAISARDLPALAAAVPEMTLIDASQVIARARMVKSPQEIANLRRAVEIAEGGIDVLAEQARPGMSRAQIAALWRAGVEASRGDAALSGAWEYISVGPRPWSGEATASAGDILKVDVGCLVSGYTSDTGRTFAFGRPAPLAARLHGALAAGFAAGQPLLSPGVPLAEVHRATTAAIRSAGFPGFTRGHFGHGLGASLGSEEWPFISADSDVVAEPGMVLAFETPWYVDGVGGLIIEDQILITGTGHEAMNRLPRDLVLL
jgi:Xaa-Pro aminopeptidase